MGTHKIYSGIQGIRDNISGSLYGDCHELLAANLLCLLIKRVYFCSNIIDCEHMKFGISCDSLLHGRCLYHHRGGGGGGEGGGWGTPFIACTGIDVPLDRVRFLPSLA